MSGLAHIPFAASSIAAARPSIMGAMRPGTMLLADTASASTSNNAPINKRSYLVWEEGFAVRFAISAAVLSILALGAQHSTAAWLTGMALRNHATYALQTLAHRLEWWSLLGLLSSSCCVLQLMLNALSFGCAGFNTVLGPLRPTFLACTLLLQACVWRNALIGRGSSLLSSAVGGSLLCLALTFLPEALHLYVQRRGAKTGAPASPIETLPAQEVCLRVGGMGCTACTVKVKSALEAVPGVAECAVELETGSARLRLAPRASHEEPASKDTTLVDIEQRAILALEAAGFEGGLAGGA